MFRSLFDPNSAFFSGMERVWTLVVLNVLWVLCSLPVVTIGPSTAALYQVLGKVIQGEDSHTARKFFAAWRENFKCALLVWLPMLAVLGLAGSLANKKSVPQSDGTLATNNAMFVGLLIAVVLIIGALSFFPALALGPIAEFVG